jgi:DNA-binding NtrC family response regulator
MSLFVRDGLPAAEAIAELCYTNPFSARRIELERRALGTAFRDAQPVWNRASSRFENPNLAALRERTGQLLHAAIGRIERGKAPSASERRVYGELARYHLFDRFDDELSALIAAQLEPRENGSAERVPFYKAFRAEVERVYGARGIFAERVQQAPHLFATSVQVRFAFAMIYQSILGTSASATQLRAATWQSIFTHDMRRYERALYAHMHQIPTLVLGPSGSGKELVARAVGLARYVPFDAAGQRFAGPLGDDFSALNLSAMAPTLIESELFGHRRGAFTGAIDERRGFFEQCGEHGSVFLDEIGELDHGVQVKLLRVLQSRQFQRVGDAYPRAFRGKLIAATNRDLAVELAAGAFRADLFYRLCADIVRTPTLSEQLAQAPDDLRTFVENAVERVVREPGEVAPLVTEIVDFVERELGSDYAWPGNVRELEQCVRSFIVQGRYSPLLRPREESFQAAGDALDRVLARTQLSADELLDRYCAAQHAQQGTYQDVARKLGLDWRTVKARVAAARMRAS